MKVNIINTISLILVIAGALNWLAIGTHQRDLVEQLAKDKARFVYIAVGIAGIHQAVLLVMQRMK